MREYSFQATDATVEALRLLRGPWTGYRVEQGAFTVRLGDAREVRVAVDGADVETDLEAFRISAAAEPALPGIVTAPDAPRFDDAPDFAVGRNDIVLFTGATWVEAAAPSGGATQFSGHPGQISETAAAVCLTTDAIVVASPVGTGFLVRTGVRPWAVDVTSDAADIARFLRERGYDAG